MKSVSRISCKKMMVSFTDCSRFVSIHVCRLFIKLSLASLGYPPRTPTVRVGYRALLSPPAPSHTIAPSSLIANFCVSGSTGLSKPASSREGRRATREQEETGRCERLLPSTTEVRTEETLLCCSPLLSPSPRAPARCHRTPTDPVLPWLDISNHDGVPGAAAALVSLWVHVQAAPSDVEDTDPRLSISTSLGTRCRPAAMLDRKDAVC
mmetsp:Transcript_39850/g.125191  ORF Transcript_39850/g.125191 Transcript_39850/m.125191 type:complete len:209 (-) Transcript_39850:427-1053(-)